MIGYMVEGSSVSLLSLLAASLISRPSDILFLFRIGAVSFAAGPAAACSVSHPLLGRAASPQGRAVARSVLPGRRPIIVAKATSCLRMLLMLSHHVLLELLTAHFLERWAARLLL